MILNEIKHELREMVPDFARRIQPVYELLNWTWRETNQAPSIQEIADNLNSLINNLKENAFGESVGGGGLEAYYARPEKDDLEGLEYGIRFVAECNNALDWLAVLEKKRASEFEVMGQRAIIQSLHPSKDRWGEPTEITAWVDFPDGLQGSSAISMGVPFPAQEFTREELITGCIGYIEVQWREEQQERQKREGRDIKSRELEVLVRDMTAKLGI